MPIGKSIRIYLPDATVAGIRYAEVVNWTGHAVTAPRNRLSDLAAWPETTRPGVYFLFESRLGDAKPLAYIGESENVFGRLASHDREKDFWNEVVVFTSKDENLTKTHIKFLEATLVGLAKNAERYNLENGNTPPESSLPRADRDAMTEFIENIRMILGTLGYPILEPLIKAQSPSISAVSLSEPSSLSPSDFFFKVNQLTACGAVTNEGFVLKKGSQIARDNASSASVRSIQTKEQLINDGRLKLNDNYFVLEEDVLLSSSSHAAGLVAGTARSGPQSWFTKDGRTLKSIEDAAVTAQLQP